MKTIKTIITVLLLTAGMAAQAQQVIVNIDMSRDEEPETVVDIQQLSD